MEAINKMKSEIRVGLATVSRNGLLINGIYYSNSKMIKKQWFEHAKINGEWQIPVLFDSSNVNQIMLFDFNNMELASSIENKVVDWDPLILIAYQEAIENLKEQLFRSRN